MSNTLIDFSNELAGAVELGGKGVVAVQEGGRSGVSGTIWRTGLVVTAEHTIRGRNAVTLVLPSGKTASAMVVGRDPSTDLALLKIADAPSAMAEFGDASQLKIGNVVLALGRRGEKGLTASYGIVSAVGGAWRTWQGGKIDQWLRLDLNPYPGFSGGPLVDAAGRVLGINTSGPRRTVMTIPRSTVDRVVDQLLSTGRIARGYIGLGGQPVMISAAVREKLGLQQSQGMLVITIGADGPAERAGVTVGDIILAANGNPVAEPADLLASLDPDMVGNKLMLRVLRGGAPTDVSVTVGERERE